MTGLLQMLLVFGLGAIGLLVLAAVVILRRRGRALAPAGAFALLVAQLPLLLAVSLANWTISTGFEAAFQEGSGAVAVADLVRRGLWLLAAGGGAFLFCAGLFALGLVPSLFGAGGEPSRRPASVRRTAFLLLLAVGGALAAGALFEYTRQTLDIARIVALTDATSAESQAAAERYPVLSMQGSQGIAAVASRIARGVVAGMLGAPWLAVVLFGGALVAVIVAWPVSASRPVVAVWLLVCLLFCLVALVQTARVGLDLRTLPARSSSAVSSA